MQVGFKSSCRRAASIHGALRKLRAFEDSEREQREGGAVHLQPPHRHKVPLIGVLLVLAPQNRKCCLVESLLLRQACKLLIDKSDRVTS